VNYVVLVVPVLAFALSCYWSVQAWRSSPETWRTLISDFARSPGTAGPSTPPWRDVDRHTERYVWLARRCTPRALYSLRSPL